MCLGAMAVVAFPFILTIVSLLRVQPLRFSEKTTSIAAPLKSDGKQVDYFAAIQQATHPGPPSGRAARCLRPTRRLTASSHSAIIWLVLATVVRTGFQVDVGNGGQFGDRESSAAVRNP